MFIPLETGTCWPRLSVAFGKTREFNKAGLEPRGWTVPVCATLARPSSFHEDLKSKSEGIELFLKITNSKNAIKDEPAVKGALLQPGAFHVDPAAGTFRAGTRCTTGNVSERLRSENLRSDRRADA